MLIISVVIADYCPQRTQCPADLDIVVYLQIVIALETIILLPVYIYYLSEYKLGISSIPRFSLVTSLITSLTTSEEIFLLSVNLLIG